MSLKMEYIKEQKYQKNSKILSKKKFLLKKNYKIRTLCKEIGVIFLKFKIKNQWQALRKILTST